MLSLILAACSTTSGESRPPPDIVYVPKVVDTACDWTKPIYVDASDVLTDETARNILAHNRAGAKNCGWKPKSK